MGGTPGLGGCLAFPQSERIPFFSVHLSGSKERGAGFVLPPSKVRVFLG